MDVPSPEPVKAPQVTVHTKDSSMDEEELGPATRNQEDSSDDSSEEEDDDNDEEDEDEDEDDESGSEDDRGGRSRAGVQSSQARRRPAGDPTITPWAREIGIDPQKMHVMQTSLFRMPEEERILKALNEPHPRRKFILKTSLSRKHSRDSEGDGLRADSRQVLVLCFVHARQCSSCLQRASFGHDVEPEPYRPSRKYARVESSASAFVGREGAYVDAGLASGRSFRVGWGPGGVLAHLGDLCGPSSSSCVASHCTYVSHPTSLQKVPREHFDNQANHRATHMWHCG